ncbi:MAG: HAMP domain-containing sensor histidine kinase [Patescibacteria group bacterium]
MAIGIFSKLNIARQCREDFNVSVWRCPTFLFLLMGVVVVVAILVSYYIANNYSSDPLVSSLLAMATAAVTFTIGHIMVQSFTTVVEANKLKSRFLNIISHELLTPMTAVRWAINTLENNPEIDAAGKENRAADMLKIIKENNDKLVSIVKDILDVSRIENGKIAIQPATFDLLSGVQKIIIQKTSELEQKQNSIELKSDDNLPLVNADPERIKTAIGNLMDNAIKYSKPNSKIIISLKRAGDHVIFEIQDFGVGIPKKEHKNIFSKFFRADNVIFYQTRGLGVGLFLAKFIIEASGGKISFESQEGSGSKFRFSLPVTK